ncbi:MAG: sigma factor [Bryobacteraceae bacterium]
MYARCLQKVQLDDLVSAGIVGLIQAVDRFQPERQCLLKTPAEHRIRGAMLDYLRQLDPMPRSVRRFVRQRDQVAERIERLQGRTAPEAEIAEVLGIPLTRYRKLDRIARAAQTRSLEAVPESAVCRRC